MQKHKDFYTVSDLSVKRQNVCAYLGPVSWLHQFHSNMYGLAQLWLVTVKREA